ncbi:MAG: Serine/threonine-protein kinase pkn1, partial [Pseudomonadota bacterium]
MGPCRRPSVCQRYCEFSPLSACHCYWSVAHARLRGVLRLPHHRPVSVALRSEGSIAFREEERVGGEGEVAAFEIDVTEVTHGQFAEFVRASGYVTVAERLGPDGQPLGAAVFDRSTGQWRIDPKANWRSPMGEGSTARDDEPVVAVAYEDAEAYARWRGRRLPTELEWERAARGDLPVSADMEAERRDASGRWLANSWQGAFPALDNGA